jgi:hypothetical protein
VSVWSTPDRWYNHMRDILDRCGFFSALVEFFFLFTFLTLYIYIFFFIGKKIKNIQTLTWSFFVKYIEEGYRIELNNTTNNIPYSKTQFSLYCISYDTKNIVYYIKKNNILQLWMIYRNEKNKQCFYFRLYLSISILFHISFAFEIFTFFKYLSSIRIWNLCCLNIVYIIINTILLDWVQVLCYTSIVLAINVYGQREMLLT